MDTQDTNNGSLDHAPDEIEKLLWGVNRSEWSAMPDAKHNRQILEAYEMGKSHGRPESPEALSLANARIAELERERKGFQGAALNAVTAAQQDQEKLAVEENTFNTQLDVDRRTIAELRAELDGVKDDLRQMRYCRDDMGRLAEQYKSELATAQQQAIDAKAETERVIDQQLRLREATNKTAKAEGRREGLEEAARAIRGMPACPFDGPCKLEPHEPCPVCGDKGDDLNAPNNCRSPLIVIRALLDATQNSSPKEGE